jgi:hypothetical protein
MGERENERGREKKTDEKENENKYTRQEDST